MVVGIMSMGYEGNENGNKTDKLSNKAEAKKKTYKDVIEYIDKCAIEAGKKITEIEKESARMCKKVVEECVDKMVEETNNLDEDEFEKMLAELDKTDKIPMDFCVLLMMKRIENLCKG